MFNLQNPSFSNPCAGWRADDDSPITVSTVYRWTTDAILSQSRSHAWEEAEMYTLFPVEVRPSIVLTYSVHKNGAALSRESQDMIAPGDYGLYTTGKNIILCITTGWVTLTHRRPLILLFLPSSSIIFENGGRSERKYPVALRQGISSCRGMSFTLSDAQQASLTRSVIQQTLGRDQTVTYRTTIASSYSRDRTMVHRWKPSYPYRWTQSA
jgi:hypothetical protein